MSLKREIAPKGLQFFPGSFIISDKYCTILTAVSLPKYIAPGYLSNLTSIPGVKVVIKHIPVPSSTITKMLNKELTDLKYKYQEERDKTVQERIRQDYESLEQFTQQVVSSQSRVFDFQLHLVIMADSKEEFDSKKLQVKNYLATLNMFAMTLQFEQETILKSIIPIFPKQAIEARIGTPIPSATIAAMYPFVFDSIKDPGLSTIMGVDFSGGVILFNQFLYQIKKEFNRNNANMIILGTSGSGKSTAAKLLLRCHIRNNYKLVAIDPEAELGEMIAEYNGDFIDLGKGGEFGMINPLEVVPDYDEEELKQGIGYTALTKTLQQLKAFIKYYDPSIEEDVLTLYTEMILETYKRFGIDYNSDFSGLTSEQYPIFSDVYNTIKSKLTSMTDKTHERAIMEKLELKIRPLIRELKYYFDGHTTIQINSNIIVFNIREVMNTDVNIRNALFFNILKYAWGLCLDVSMNTVLMVDEAHVLLSSNNIIGADFLAQIQRRARKYNTGTIVITQQPSDFCDASVITQGKAIFDNASYYLVMGLKKQAVEDLAMLIDLNENEKEGIKRYGQGEALFVCGGRRMQIRIIVTDEELESFGSRGGL